MRKMKKLIATLSAALMLFSFTAPAMAADTAAATVSKAAIGKDVKGTKYEEDAKKLIALGIINGFEDGTVRPDATVTRAQFAAIVAQELGIAEGVGQAATKFKDVPASHWASGVINLAVGKGIIVGFGDGTFKPDAPVTYAQAYAMLTQMLGYGPALKGAAWPSGVLAKAASLGVSKGVTGAANAEMKRGDVIKAAANSLTIDIMEQDEYGDSNVYKKQDKTILSEVFNVTVFNDSFKNGDDDNAKGYLEVDNVPMIDLGGLEADEIEFDNLAGTFAVSSALNPNDFLGQNVEAWVDEDDDEVLYLGPSDDETVIVDTIDEVTGGEITLKDADEDYEIKDGAKVWINIADSGYGEYGDEYDDNDLDLEGATVKVVLNNDDEVIAAVITDWAQGATGYVTAVNADDESIEYNDNGSEDDLDLEDADYAIIKDGAPATLADIKVGDVVSYLEGDKDEVYIAVSSTQVKGTADISWGDASDSADDFDITVGDVKYDINANATYSDNANKDIEALNPSDIKDLNDEEVTLYLDVKGDVAHVVTGAIDGDSSDLVAVITKEARYNSYDDEVKFEMVNKAGQELTFEFDPDDVKVDGYGYDNVDIDGADWEGLWDLDFNKLEVVKYELDSAGKLEKIEEYNGSFEADTTIDVNEDDKTLTIGTGDYAVTEDTVIFDVTDTVSSSIYGSKMDDVKTTTWDSIKDEDQVTGRAIVDGDNVEYLFVTSGDLTTEGLYAVVTGFASNGDDDQVKLLLPDGSATKVVLDATTATKYVYGETDGTRALKKGDFIRYELNSDNEIDEMQILGKAEGGYASATLTGMDAAELAALDLDYVFNGVVTDHSSSSITVNLADESSKKFTINSNTKFFNISDIDELDDARTVKDGYTVIVIDTDDDNKSADYVIIVSEDALTLYN